jgi:TPR repeat protein
MYQNGWGVEQDYKIAEEYFHKAINRGETTGYSALAVMKEKHLPNPDYKEILNLFLKDAPNGHPNAIMGIQRLYAEHPKETKKMSCFGSMSRNTKWLPILVSQK